MATSGVTEPNIAAARASPPEGGRARETIRSSSGGPDMRSACLTNAADERSPTTIGPRAGVGDAAVARGLDSPNTIAASPATHDEAAEVGRSQGWGSERGSSLYASAERERADRHVDVEDPAPARAADQPAEDRAEVGPSSIGAPTTLITRPILCGPAAWARMVIPAGMIIPPPTLQHAEEICDPADHATPDSTDPTTNKRETVIHTPLCPEALRCPPSADHHRQHDQVASPRPT